jgi:solute:Na+ symporter, SSS family
MVDIHYKFGWSKDLKGLKLPRIATFVLGLAGITFGLMMATMDIKSLWDEFQKILGLVLGSLGGLFLLGLLTRRANGVGAIIGIVGSILIQIWVSKTQPVHLLLYAATGFISCFIIGYISSLIFTASNKEVAHLTIFGLLKKRKNQ